MRNKRFAYPANSLSLVARSKDGCIFISRNSPMAKLRDSNAADFSAG